MQAELLISTKGTLSEGPVWHQGLQRLFWVDIEGRKIHTYDPMGKQHINYGFEKMPGALVPVDDHTLLVSFEDGTALFDLNSGTVDYKNQLLADIPDIRTNDGKCDPNGVYWIGSLHLELAPGTGQLFRIGSDYQSVPQVDDLTIANGLAWSTDHKTMYFIDTAANEVMAFDFDKSTSEIGNRRVVIKVKEQQGGPDGMTIDEDDNLWIAHWGGFCIRQWNPITGKVLQEIEVPVPNVTSCTFGGEQLDELFITTASSGLSPEEREKYPESGSIFKVKPGVKGRPTDFFNTKP